MKDYSRDFRSLWPKCTTPLQRLQLLQIERSDSRVFAHRHAAIAKQTRLLEIKPTGVAYDARSLHAHLRSLPMGWGIRDAYCDWRAFLGGALARRERIPAELVQVNPANPQNSTIRLTDGRGTREYFWAWHVALKVGSRVVDPALFENPVEENVWDERLREAGYAVGDKSYLPLHRRHRARTEKNWSEGKQLLFVAIYELENAQLLETFLETGELGHPWNDIQDIITLEPQRVSYSPMPVIDVTTGHEHYVAHR